MRTTRKLLVGIAASVAVAGLALVVPAVTRPAAAASLTQVTNFGNNPGNMQMYVYVPNSVTASPAILVAMHGCGGSGPGFYSGSEFASLADRYGFIVIYPTATQQAGFGNCFDTWSDAAKRRGGGSDPVSLVSMITYVEQQYHGDAGRVYATGSSSGGMMTNEMLALYPDVFAAGAAFMGVPFGCFANAADYAPSSSKCTTGQLTHTPQEWGDMVRNAYPGYSGARPKVQLWHGTADTLVPYSRLQEEIKQWTNVFGLSQTPTSTDTPVSGWNRSRFADSSGIVDVEAYSISGAGHALPQSGQAAYAISFFGLDRTGPTTAPTTGPTGPVGACTATYKLVNSWPGGFQAQVDITASGSINGWTVKMTMASGQTISSLWNGVLTGNSGAVSVKNAAYNTNAPTNFGFVANGSSSPAPSGISCSSP